MVEVPIGIVSILRFFNIEDAILPEDFLSDLSTRQKDSRWIDLLYSLFTGRPDEANATGQSKATLNDSALFAALTSPSLCEHTHHLS